MLDGSRVTFDPAVRVPAGTWALSAPSAVDVAVASSVKVAPLPVVSKIRSPESDDVGIATLKVPLASDVVLDVATTTPAVVLTVTVAPVAGPAKIVPVMAVVGVVRAGEPAELEPPHPANAVRQRNTMQQHIYFVMVIAIFSL